MGKNDTKYLKFNGSSWVFQKRLNSVEQEFLGVKTKVHNKSLETDSQKEACIKRDAILLQLSKANQQDKSPQYSALLEKYQGYSKEELKKKLEDKGELLSDNFNYIGHPEYKGELEEPTEAQMLEYKSLQVLSSDKNKNIIEDKYRLKLSQAFEALMIEKEDLPDKNKKTYARSVKIFLDYLNKDDVLMYVIDRFMIRKFTTALKKKYEPSTIRTTLSNLGLIWAYARDAEKYIDENPFSKQGLPSKDKNLKYYVDWTIDELYLILKNIRDRNDKLPIYIAWYTGSRLDEVYSIAPDDIYVDKVTGVKVISFKPKKDGKNVYATRIVPVHYALEEHISGFNGWNRSTSNAYGKYFGALKRKLGFTDKKKAFHSIRGNTSTNFENLKVPEHIANKIVGHKSRGDTMTYGYYSQGPGLIEAKEVVNKLPVL
jgi:integrase